MTLNIHFFLSQLANTCSQLHFVAIKTMEIGDKFQILKGTVQKQMILHYFRFKLNAACSCDRSLKTVC